MTAPSVVRAARPDDLPSLTNIYNHYVRTSDATFDDTEFSIDQRREWFAHYRDTGPHRLLVAERDGVVVGYATSSPFRPKPGYRTTVETTVYVAADSVGDGIGGELYGRLLRIVDDEGVHRAVAGIAVPNPASVALHRRFGFTEVGTYTEVGMKFGRYLDVQWFERASGGSPVR